MVADIQPLVLALQNKLQVVLTYQKKTTSEVVQHQIGIYEINSNDPSGAVLWGFDVIANDHIRKFLISNIQSFQVLDIPFVPNGIWPIKLEGQVIG